MDRNRGWTLNINGPMNVALRKESVDRNGVSLGCIKEVLLSLSARRAWIEMSWFLSALSDSVCRSPQGERG